MKENKIDRQSTDESEKKTETDWGFNAGRSGMATETKIGLLLIVALLGAFGFVVYKKIDKPAETQAKTIKPDEKEGSKDIFGEKRSADDMFSNDGHHHPAGHASVKDNRTASKTGNSATSAVHHHPAPKPVAPATGVKPFDPTKGGEPFAADLPKKAIPPKPQPIDDFDPFDSADQAEPTVNKAGPKKLDTKLAQRDEFGSPLETGWSEDIAPEKQGTPAKLQPKVGMPQPKTIDKGFDPVAESRRPAAKTFVDNKASNEVMDLFEEEIKRSPKPPKPAHGTHTHAALEGDMTGSPDWNETAKTTPAPTRKPPAPETTAKGDDPFHSSSPFEADSERRKKPEDRRDDKWGKHVGGRHHHHDDPNEDILDAERADVYVVESGDNYWAISRKKYGTARYYTALARFNERRIPDPKAMRPGMKVLVPNPQRLEALFPHLVSGKSGVVQASGDGGYCAQTAGFFVTENGQPMYRVGKKDTLTEIAKHHLGRPSRWIQVFQLNRDRLTTPNDLKIGTELVLPSDASQVRMVAEPSEFR